MERQVLYRYQDKQRGGFISSVSAIENTENLSELDEKQFEDGLAKYQAAAEAQFAKESADLIAKLG